MDRNSNLVVFDLDGTLIRKDSFLAFLIYAFLRSPLRWWRSPLLFLGVLRHKSGFKSNSWLKSYFLKHVIGGFSPSERDRLVEKFLDSFLPQKLRPFSAPCLEKHRHQKDVLLLLSASPDFLVRPLARRLGLDWCECTECEKDAKGRITGKLIGGNCYGDNKVTRLKELQKQNGPFDRLVVYTDHHSDWPLLKKSNRGIAVNPTSKLRELIQNAPHIVILDGDEPQQGG